MRGANNKSHDWQGKGLISTLISEYHYASIMALKYNIFERVSMWKGCHLTECTHCPSDQKINRRQVKEPSAMICRISFGAGMDVCLTGRFKGGLAFFNMI